jgi:hypothetical protein
LTTIILIGCGKAKKDLAKSIINSYSQAVKEEDEKTILKLFPDIKYFPEYPKIDKVEIKEIEIDKINKNNVMAVCTLNYTTGLGKTIEQEIRLLVNTKDSTIINVLGYLTRKDRNEIMERWYFKTFTDLQPKAEDMDVNFVKNDEIALNRMSGYEYYATKAIGKNSEVSIQLNQKVRTYYSIKSYYNTKIDISIKNNSSFDCEYLYKDDNYEITYEFPSFRKTGIGILGCEGIFSVKSGETITRSVLIPDESYSPMEKDKISIKPNLESIEIDKNKGIVDKYYGEDIKNEIIAGFANYSSTFYDYKITSK